MRCTWPWSQGVPLSLGAYFNGLILTLKNVFFNNLFFWKISLFILKIFFFLWNSLGGLKLSILTQIWHFGFQGHTGQKKIIDFDPNCVFPDCNSSLNSLRAIKWCTKLEATYRRGALLSFKVIYQISKSHGKKMTDFDPNWAFLDCNSSLNSTMALKWCT